MANCLELMGWGVVCEVNPIDLTLGLIKHGGCEQPFPGSGGQEPVLQSLNLPKNVLIPAPAPPQPPSLSCLLVSSKNQPGPGGCTSLPSDFTIAVSQMRMLRSEKGITPCPRSNPTVPTVSTGPWDVCRLPGSPSPLSHSSHSQPALCLPGGPCSCFGPLQRPPRTALHHAPASPWKPWGYGWTAGGKGSGSYLPCQPTPATSCCPITAFAFYPRAPSITCPSCRHSTWHRTPGTVTAASHTYASG